MVDDKLDAAFIQGIPAVATEHLAHTSDPGIPGAKACGSLGVMGFCGGKSYAIKLQPRGDDLSPIICKTPIFLFVFAYDWRMPSLDDCIENKQMSGYSTFTREDALAELSLKPEAFTAALTRQISRKRLANPRHGFYIIPRPEDRTTGAPDPARWIDPLMKYLGTDYRISLLRAAAMHSSSHQAAMVFQVVVPQQFRSIIIGRHRIQFVHLAPSISSATNQKDWLTDTGYAQAAGVELTLLDCIRYFKRATGINGVAQITKDIGNRARSKKIGVCRAALRKHVGPTTRLPARFVKPQKTGSRCVAIICTAKRQIHAARPIGKAAIRGPFILRSERLWTLVGSKSGRWTWRIVWAIWKSIFCSHSTRCCATKTSRMRPQG
ncbi:type IV toxin-antitoxin system AbiEi family antitoxin (plasmid) [Rhizobium ruizarguesonis]|nr:type IV toxin-antitoxin system AbiEi family antitoxin [Rhizobium ruizarguesonis]